jgi:hypothetical protein
MGVRRAAHFSSELAWMRLSASERFWIDGTLRHRRIGCSAAEHTQSGGRAEGRNACSRHGGRGLWDLEAHKVDRNLKEDRSSSPLLSSETVVRPDMRSLQICRICACGAVLA